MFGRFGLLEALLACLSVAGGASCEGSRQTEIAFNGVRRIADWSGLPLTADDYADIRRFVVRVQTLAEARSFDELRAYVEESIDGFARNVTLSGAGAPESASARTVGLTCDEMTDVSKLYLVLSHLLGAHCDAVAIVEAVQRAFDVKAALGARDGERARQAMLESLDTLADRAIAEDSFTGTGRRDVQDAEGPAGYYYGLGAGECCW